MMYLYDVFLILFIFMYFHNSFLLKKKYFFFYSSLWILFVLKNSNNAGKATLLSCKVGGRIELFTKLTKT